MKEETDKMPYRAKFNLAFKKLYEIKKFLDNNYIEYITTNVGDSFKNINNFLNNIEFMEDLKPLGKVNCFNCGKVFYIKDEEEHSCDD
jgi:hypothetical protein